MDTQNQPTSPPTSGSETPKPLNNKPEAKFTDAEAQALLAINSLGTEEKAKSSKSFLFIVIASIILIVAISIALELRNHSKTNATNNTTTTSTSSKNPFTSGSSTVNSEVKYCSNPINAQTSC